MMPGSGSSANKGGELKRAASTVSYWYNFILYYKCILIYWKYIILAVPSLRLLMYALIMRLLKVV